MQMWRVWRYAKAVAWLSAALLSGARVQADTWQPSGISGQSVFALARDTGGTLYAGAFSLLYASTDTGVTWSVLPDPPSGTADVFGLAVNPLTNHLFLVSEPGVFRSEDGGTSWEFLGDDLVGAYHIVARGDGLLAVTGSTGTYLSADDGGAWDLVHPIGGGSFLGDGLGLLPTGEFIELNHESLYRSSGQGQLWADIAGVRDSGAMVSSFAIDRVGDIVYRADHRVKDSLFRIGYVLYRSYTEGEHWQRVDSGLYTIPEPLFCDSRGIVWAGRDNLQSVRGLYQSADSGASWVSTSDASPGVAGALCFLEFSPGLLLVGTSDSGMYRLTFTGGSCCVLPGDANHDSKVNASDVILLVNYVFKAGPGPACTAQSDANADSKISSADIILAVNFIFKSGTPLGCGSGDEGRVGT